MTLSEKFPGARPESTRPARADVCHTHTYKRISRDTIIVTIIIIIIVATIRGIMTTIVVTNVDHQRNPTRGLSLKYSIHADRVRCAVYTWYVQGA